MAYLFEFVCAFTVTSLESWCIGESSPNGLIIPGGWNIICYPDLSMIFDDDVGLIVWYSLR